MFVEEEREEIFEERLGKKRGLSCWQTCPALCTRVPLLSLLFLSIQTADRQVQFLSALRACPAASNWRTRPGTDELGDWIHPTFHPCSEHPSSLILRFFPQGRDGKEGGTVVHGQGTSPFCLTGLALGLMRTWARFFPWCSWTLGSG